MSILGSIFGRRKTRPLYDEKTWDNASTLGKVGIVVGAVAVCALSVGILFAISPAAITQIGTTALIYAGIIGAATLGTAVFAVASKIRDKIKEKKELKERSVDLEESISNELENSVKVDKELENSIKTNKELETSVKTNKELENSMKTNKELENSMKTNKELETSMKTNKELETSMKTNKEIENSTKVNKKLTENLRKDCTSLKTQHYKNDTANKKTILEKFKNFGKNLSNSLSKKQDLSCSK